MDKKHDHEEDCCCEKDEHHHDECCCHHDHEHEEHVAVTITKTNIITNIKVIVMEAVDALAVIMKRNLKKKKRKR